MAQTISEKTAAALVVLNFSVPLEAAQRGVKHLGKTFWGGVKQADGYHTFPVSYDWDGHRFTGYFLPSIAEVAMDTGKDWWNEWRK